MSAPLAVLVVDDDAFVRSTIVSHLQPLPVDPVRTAATAAEARALLKAERFGLIVCDLQLPGEDGAEFLRTIALAQGDAAIVVVAGLTEAILRTVGPLCRERRLRVIGSLGKPLRREYLLGLLTELTTQPEGVQKRVTVGDIERAMRRGAIGARVQPIVQAGSGALHSAEFLADWSDSRLGRVAPQELVAVADASGIIKSLNDYLTALALRSASAWHAAGLKIPIAVNVTATALPDTDFPNLVGGLIKSAGLSAGMLGVEVAEADLHASRSTLEVLGRLRSRGVRVAADNFGITQGALARLEQLPVTQIKIDRSLVGQLPQNKAIATLVRQALQLAHSLSLETVAVGVETAAQAEALTGLGCQLLQGYWIARPMAPEQLVAWAAGRKPGDG